MGRLCCFDKYRTVPWCFATQTVKGGLSEMMMLVWASSLHRDQANICRILVLVCVADMEIPQAQPLSLPVSHFLRP